MVRRKFYHRRVVIGSSIAMLVIYLRCARKSTAVVLVIVMQHDAFASLAQQNCNNPIWRNVLKTIYEYPHNSAWVENSITVTCVTVLKMVKALDCVSLRC